jgi:hypothetical protein
MKNIVYSTFLVLFYVLNIPIFMEFIEILNGHRGFNGAIKPVPVIIAFSILYLCYLLFKGARKFFFIIAFYPIFIFCNITQGITIVEILGRKSLTASASLVDDLTIIILLFCIIWFIVLNLIFVNYFRNPVNTIREKIHFSGFVFTLLVLYVFKMTGYF